MGIKEEPRVKAACTSSPTVRFRLLSFLAFARFYSTTKLLTSKSVTNLKLLPCCVEAIRSTNTALSHPGEQTQNTRTDRQTDRLL